MASSSAEAPLLRADAADEGCRLEAGGRRRLERLCTALLGVGLLASAGLVAIFSVNKGDAPVLSGAALMAAKVGKVTVEVYGMAGCPFTRAFIEGPLSEAIETSGDIVDLQLHPFGNTYFVTEECGGTGEGMPFASYFAGYDINIRECWDKICGAAAETPARDCFSGDLVCQHGQTDGMVTTAWACAKNASNGAAQFLRFVRCSGHRFLSITSKDDFAGVISSCADVAGLSERSTLACARGDQGRQLLIREARQTIAHPAVPYVLIDGAVLEEKQCVTCGVGILSRICTAWRARGGEDTPVCKAVLR